MRARTWLRLASQVHSRRLPGTDSQPRDTLRYPVSALRQVAAQAARLSGRAVDALSRQIVFISETWRRRGLEKVAMVERHSFGSIDGTEHFCSKPTGCKRCSQEVLSRSSPKDPVQAESMTKPRRRRFFRPNIGRRLAESA